MDGNNKNKKEEAVIINEDEKSISAIDENEGKREEVSESGSYDSVKSDDSLGDSLESYQSDNYDFLKKKIDENEKKIKELEESNKNHLFALNTSYNSKLEGYYGTVKKLFTINSIINFIVGMLLLFFILRPSIFKSDKSDNKKEEE